MPDYIFHDKYLALEALDQSKRAINALSPLWGFTTLGGHHCLALLITNVENKEEEYEKILGVIVPTGVDRKGRAGWRPSVSTLEEGIVLVFPWRLDWKLDIKKSPQGQIIPVTPGWLLKGISDWRSGLTTATSAPLPS